MLPGAARLAGTQRVLVESASGSMCLAGCVRTCVDARLWRQALLCWSAQAGRAHWPTCGLCLECVSGGVL